MIYFITRQKSIDVYKDIQICDLEFMYRYFESKKYIATDCETEGFDVYLKNVLLIQFGDFDNQFVVDCTTIDLLEMREFLEDKSKTFLYHNAKFDLKFLLHKGIVQHRNVYDTFLGERIITCGDSSHRKSLQDCVRRYFKIELSKEERGLIHKLGVYDSHIIKYSALDVKYLIGIREFQLRKAKELELTKTIELENKFVSVLTYVEYSGIKLNVEGWSKKSEEDFKLMSKLKNELDQMVLDMDKPKYLADGDLFNPKPHCNILWSSSDQVIPLFEELGLNLDTIDKKTGKPKKSVESKIINSQKDIHPIVEKFIEYQQAAKLVSTYGKGFLKHIHSLTGRIHTNFNQIMNTGRLSSGKEDPKDAKPGEVNMQNIPAGKERSYFIPEKDNVFVVADYSAQETKVLCYYAKDPEYTDYVTNPEKDLHSFVARLVFKEKLSDKTDMEIKKYYKNDRTFVKPGTFTIPYGGNGFTISQNLNIPIERGDYVYTEFMNRFPGLNDYFTKMREEAIKNGYVLMDPITGRKWFFTNTTLLYATRKRLEEYSSGKYGKDFQGLSAGFWDIWKQEKAIESPKFAEMKMLVKKYFKMVNSMGRTGLNAPIQGTSASISKLAGIKMYDWILENNYLNIVKICVPLHDEYCVESPENIKNEVANMVQESMESAAKVFCPTLEIAANPVIGYTWDH